MEHLAIMRKSWGLTQKILTGQKKIESRWYKNRHRPWNQITKGETIFFKDSGNPVTIKAKVKKVLQFSNLTPSKVRDILNEYGSDDGIEKEDLPKYKEMFEDKKYCILIYLENPENVTPFQIDKTGFGAMSAWITVKSVGDLKI